MCQALCRTYVSFWYGVFMHGLGLARSCFFCINLCLRWLYANYFLILVSASVVLCILCDLLVGDAVLLWAFLHVCCCCRYVDGLVEIFIWSSCVSEVLQQVLECLAAFCELGPSV